MNSILAEIIQQKQLEINKLTHSEDFPWPVRDFRQALFTRKPAVIAELKKASPSRGLLRKEFDPLVLAKYFEQKGAAAISVLTEAKYFQGDINYLPLLRKKIRIPLLRKDFMLVEEQIFESRHYGADAVLLIARILSESRLHQMITTTERLGMSALVEVHDEADITKALKCQAKIIGINNRDLDTFEVDLKVTERLWKLIPKDRIIVMESGIFSKKDIHPQVQAVLIGEGLINDQEGILDAN
jgi:indole-3-glycerol phosphate synthase